MTFTIDIDILDQTTYIFYLFLPFFPLLFELSFSSQRSQAQLPFFPLLLESSFSSQLAQAQLQTPNCGLRIYERREPLAPDICLVPYVILSLMFLEDDLSFPVIMCTKSLREILVMYSCMEFRISLTSFGV